MKINGFGLELVATVLLNLGLDGRPCRIYVGAWTAMCELAL